jgi:hypothetical protein
MSQAVPQHTPHACARAPTYQSAARTTSGPLTRARRARVWPRGVMTGRRARAKPRDHAPPRVARAPLLSANPAGFLDRPLYVTLLGTAPHEAPPLRRPGAPGDLAGPRRALPVRGCRGRRRRRRHFPRGERGVAGYMGAHAVAGGQRQWWLTQGTRMWGRSGGFSVRALRKFDTSPFSRPAPPALPTPTTLPHAQHLPPSTDAQPLPPSPDAPTTAVPAAV